MLSLADTVACEPSALVVPELSPALFRNLGEADSCHLPNRVAHGCFAAIGEAEPAMGLRDFAQDPGARVIAELELEVPLSALRKDAHRLRGFRCGFRPFGEVLPVSTEGFRE